MASSILSRVRRTGFALRLISASFRPEPLSTLAERASCPPVNVPFQPNWMSGHTALVNASFKRTVFSSSAAPEAAEKEASRSLDDKNSEKATEDEIDTESSKATSDPNAEPTLALEDEVSMDDLVKLVIEKEELLKLKHKEVEKMQDKVLRSYAEMENVMDRAKREAENSKKYAVQNFAKSLLDVADNLGRASSVVKESFSKLDTSKDNAGAVPLLKTLLEGVEMTDKQLSEVFRKFGVEKFDPINEQFDPNRHYAVFQVPDASKPPGTVAAVLKTGYTLHDRVLRPAEVGVTGAADDSLNSQTEPDSGA